MEAAGYIVLYLNDLSSLSLKMCDDRRKITF